MKNSITNEGINIMNKAFGKTPFDDDIDTGALIQLYNRWSQGNLSPHFGISAVYLMGKIDGIRQERKRRKNTRQQCEITIGNRKYVLTEKV